MIGSKTIGIVSNKTFIMRRRGSRHMPQKPRLAWCVSESIFYGDIVPCCDSVVVVDVETGISYRVSTKTFERRCFLVERPPYEPQVALELRHWTVSDGKTQRVQEPAPWQQTAFQLLG
ncbi:MAG: hypothetical protein QUS33_06105, partial [Dehalococcoidia bacterium]|nr:hypothetical protein [Dehalococcoidia bacterium]